MEYNNLMRLGGGESRGGRIEVGQVRDELWLTGHRGTCVTILLEPQNFSAGDAVSDYCISSSTREILYGKEIPGGPMAEENAVFPSFFYGIGEVQAILLLAGTSWNLHEQRQVQLYGSTIDIKLMHLSSGEAFFALSQPVYRWPHGTMDHYTWELRYLEGQSMPHGLNSRISFEDGRLGSCNFMEPPPGGCSKDEPPIRGSGFVRGDQPVSSTGSPDWQRFIDRLEPSPHGLPGGRDCPSQWLGWEETLDHAATQDPAVARMRDEYFVVEAAAGIDQNAGLLRNMPSAYLEMTLSDADGKTINFRVTREAQLTGPDKWSYESPSRLLTQRQEPPDLESPVGDRQLPTMVSYCHALNVIKDLQPDNNRVRIQNKMLLYDDDFTSATNTMMFPNSTWGMPPQVWARSSGSLVIVNQMTGLLWSVSDHIADA